jgi:hypothetical protein
MRHAFLCLLVLAGPALADPRLAGTYEGSIQSAGQDLPGTTRLIVSDTGAIGGAYVYQDGTVQEPGQLRGCEFDGRILRCAWFDRYGTGTLVVAFDPDFRAFRGSWYDASLPQPHDRPDGGYAWTGTRVGG